MVETEAETQIEVRPAATSVNVPALVELVEEPEVRPNGRARKPTKPFTFIGYTMFLIIWALIGWGVWNHSGGIGLFIYAGFNLIGLVFMGFMATSESEL